MSGFTVKDSGQRQQFDSGMVRDTTDDKVLWHLVASGPMLERWAQHLTAGAVKYGPDNWLLASGEAEYNRFRQSAFRHFMQWYLGYRDEDHGAAVFFNINGAEYVRDQLEDIYDECPDAVDAPLFQAVGRAMARILTDKQGPGPGRLAAPEEDA